MTVTSSTGPGRVSQFLWGPDYGFTFTFAYPAILDSETFWSAPQQGSETGQVNDGQDAWVIGDEFGASLTARWLTPQAWSEFQLFLDWATGGGAFAIVPDAVNAPDYAVTGCLLVEPFGDVNPGLEDNGLQTIVLIVRNPSFDMGLAWR